METISSFRDKYRYLSNFYYCVVELDGTRYYAVENAYQAAKVDPDFRRPFQKCTPGRSKTLSRELGIMPDFDLIKVEVMRNLLEQKFYPGSDLAGKLMSTGFVDIIEGNTWGDTFWGGVSW